jgi:hypothetical protein
MAMHPADITISNFKVDGTVDSDLLKVGENKDGILITRIQLVPKGNITAQKALFDLIIEAEKTGDVLASRNMRQRLTVFAYIDNAGRFVRCGSGGTTVEEKVCGIIAEGEYLYDPVTGKCIPRYSTQCYPGSDAFTATCPSGVKISPGVDAETSCQSTASDPMTQTLDRVYTDGDTGSARPEHYKCKVISDSSVQCIYAVDVPTAGAICSACCIKETTL